MKEINYPEVSDLLKDKVILITGAGNGIGKAVSIAAAKHGATVVLIDRDLASLNITYDEIIEASNTQPVIFQLDLKTLDDEKSLELLGGIYNEFGKLDAILHNVGIIDNISPYEHFATENWQEVFHVNVHAPFILTKNSLPLLRQSTSPSIIFTGSEQGLNAKAYWGPYAASKFATEGMMQTLGDELEHENIKVNLIDPGIVATKLRASIFPGEDPRTLAMPEEITDIYLYLFSDDSKGVTKQRFNAWRK